MSEDRPLTNGSYWPGAGAPSPNFIAREQSLRGQVMTGRFRASNSEIWRARLGQFPPFDAMR